MYIRINDLATRTSDVYTMIRLIVLIALTAAAVHSADHNLFKNCSRIRFCKDLRDKELDDSVKFSAVPKKTDYNKNVLIIPLTNANGQKLQLQVSILLDHKARVKILEENSKRYELEDVLDDEPVTLPVMAYYNNEYIKISPLNNADYHIIVTYGTPFTIEFYIHDLLQVTLKGDRLFMENTDSSQAFAFDVEFQDAQRLYGLHHHAIDLELTETKSGAMDPFRLRNSDNAGYEVGSPMALYGAVPAIYGHSNISTSGIFLHNAAEQWVEISYPKEKNPSAYFMVESGTLDLFVLLGPDTKNVVRQFTGLTGVAHLPQLWTLGYHQCRWSYYTQEDVKEVIAKMDQNDFPMDAIWLDIDYTDGKKYFTWNPTNYSDPIELQKNISSTNRKLVTILDPHIKVDESYEVYKQAKGKHFVKWENGSDFQGQCWPGLSSYLDFLNPETRDYYASWYSYEKFKGSTATLAGVWNDMNEPSVFDDSLEKTLPFEVLHHNNVKHRDIHNIYGFLQTKATHQGLMQRDNNTKRPFVLTRSHFAGSQRYAAMWTGDNTADWPYLRVSYSECMLSGLQGLVFCGADIGGFFNNVGPELLQRWYQAGVWLPFYRGHASDTTERREPYLFDKEVQKNIRNALKLRYKHIPVIYTLFYEHTRNGDPIVRPLFYHYPDLVNKNDHILLGSDILARPVMDKGATEVEVTFPGDSSAMWYRMDDGSYGIYHGGSSETFPVDISTSPYFYRGGSVIARKDVERRSTTDGLQDGYSFYSILDSNGYANGTLYVDDYESFDYLHKALYHYLRLEYINGELTITEIDGRSIGYEITIDKFIVYEKSDAHTYKKTVLTETSDGTPLRMLKMGRKGLHLIKFNV